MLTFIDSIRLWNYRLVMAKVGKITEINENLIKQWRTPNIEKILRLTELEENLLLAYENGLYGTPVNLKLNPREMIYVISTFKNLSPSFLKEVKAMTKSWISNSSATWNDNVPPFYSVELDYIVLRL